MYAFVSNEYRTIVYTQRHLDFLISMYSYPQFQKVATVAEAHKFFQQCNRKFLESGLNKYGRANNIGYITIQYFIDGKNIYANVNTKHFGFIKLTDLPNNVKQDSSYDLLKLKVCNVMLDDTLIAHHCTAIANILSLFDRHVNIELVLPDISIYIALVKYKGNNFSIGRAQDAIGDRAGSIFYTIR